MFERLISIKRGKSHLSKSIAINNSPVKKDIPPTYLYKKKQAAAIDQENQRLLKALIGSNPAIESTRGQILDYKKVTISYKKRKAHFYQDNSAFKMFLKKKVS